MEGERVPDNAAVAGPSSSTNRDEGARAGADDSAVEDQLSEGEWFQVKDISLKKRYPTVVLKLLEDQLTSSKSGTKVSEIMTGLCHLLMIESGFVPVVNQKLLRSAKNLAEMQADIRVAPLVGDLMKILEIAKSLRKVPYRYILADQKSGVGSTEAESDVIDNPPEEGAMIGYNYNDVDLTQTVLKENDGVRLILRTPEGQENFKVSFPDVLPFVNSANLESTSLSPMNFLLRGGFKSEKFAHSIKHGYIYPFLESHQALCEDFRGLSYVPDEVLIEVSKHMDMRTFVSFSMVNRRNHNLLRYNDEIWRSQLLKIKADMKNYGLPVPHCETFTTSEQKGSNAMIYKSVYLDAVQASMRRRHAYTRRGIEGSLFY